MHTHMQLKHTPPAAFFFIHRRENHSAHSFGLFNHHLFEP